MRLNRLLSNIENLNVENVAVTVLQSSENLLTESNREQLLDGLRSDGTQVAPQYRNPEYASMKQSMNSRPNEGTPDLKLTGDFHASIKHVVDSSGLIRIEANDIHGLTDKYSDMFSNIFVLNSESKKQLKERHLQKKTIDTIKERIFL
jgi:hypothetical protein